MAAPVASAAPDLIDVRVLLVAYQGAAGADASVKRTRAEALERAHMLVSMAKSGDRFSELVPKYTDRLGVGDELGVVRMRVAQPTLLSAQLAQAAAALPIAAISEPVEGPEGFFVLERRPDPPVGPTRIAAKHILIGYVGSPQGMDGVTRTEAEARALAETVVKLAREPDADWDALATQYTDEPGGKARHGDLGKFERGKMVPAFERAAFVLDVGQVSDVVQSPFGFHVIKRYE